MPRRKKAGAPCAPALKARLQLPLTADDKRFAELLRHHRVATGLGLNGQRQRACISEQIGKLFEQIKERLEVVAFAERGLGKKPRDGTDEAASYEDIHAMAWSIAEKQRKQRGGTSPDRSA